ncbi:MAG: hypothetical protein F7B06_07440 [Opitutae bacterium]|nr:hypothetical protein [Opitutae bacterium]
MCGQDSSAAHYAYANHNSSSSEFIDGDRYNTNEESIFVWFGATLQVEMGESALLS